MSLVTIARRLKQRLIEVIGILGEKSFGVFQNGGVVSPGAGGHQCCLVNGLHARSTGGWPELPAIQRHWRLQPGSPGYGDRLLPAVGANHPDPGANHRMARTSRRDSLRQRPGEHQRPDPDLGGPKRDPI